MATSEVTYKGKLRTICLHLESNSEVITDAPKDNNGEGKAFSPTDLVATSLASCMLTVCGIRAEKSKMDLQGARAEVKKFMTDTPRRIGKIEVSVVFSGNFSEGEKKVLVEVAKSCPVALSLHPDIEQDIQISFES